MAIGFSTNFERTGGAFLLQDADLRGGYRTAASIAERDAIPIAARKPGMVVRVTVPGGFEDWEIGYGKPLTNAGWIKSTLGGAKGDFIPVAGGDLKGVLKLNEFGAIDFNGALKAQVFDDNVQWTNTVEIGDDDPEPRGMMTWNDGTQNTVEINTTLGQIVCKTEVAISSDRSLKNDIRRIENSLEITNRLSGNTFTKKGIPGRRYTGLIAQEVAQVLPEAVERTSDGKLAVFYSTLAGLFVENINALVSMFKGQQKEIDALKEELRELKEIVSEMKEFP